jgi:hypothetical protein
MLCPFSSLREIDLKTCGSIDDALDGRTKIVDRGRGGSSEFAIGRKILTSGTVQRRLAVWLNHL